MAGSQVDSPVTGVPPICVEVAIGESSKFCKCPQYILKDDKEDKQKSDHEGEQKHADGLRKYKGFFGDTGGVMELGASLCQDRKDVLFADQGEQEDTTKHSHGFPANF